MIGHALPLAAILKSFVIGLVVFGLVLLGWRRSRQIERELQEMDSDELYREMEDGYFESEEELRRAEREVARSAAERRSVLSPEFQLCAQLSTFQGFRDKDLVLFLERLEEQGIRAQVILEDAMSPKAGRQMQIVGVFELYVHEDDLDQAEPFIDEFIQAKVGGRPSSSSDFSELGQAPVL